MSPVNLKDGRGGLAPFIVGGQRPTESSKSMRGGKELKGGRREEGSVIVTEGIGLNKGGGGK